MVFNNTHDIYQFIYINFFVFRDIFDNISQYITIEFYQNIFCVLFCEVNVNCF